MSLTSKSAMQNIMRHNITPIPVCILNSNLCSQTKIFFSDKRKQWIHVSRLWPGTFVPKYCYELYDLTFKSHTAEKIYIILKN